MLFSSSVSMAKSLTITELSFCKIAIWQSLAEQLFASALAFEIPLQSRKGSLPLQVGTEHIHL